MVFDLVVQGELGAGVAGGGGVELVAQGGEGAGPAGRGQRVEPDGQGGAVGDDVAAGGKGFADQGVCLVAGAGVMAVQGAARMVSALYAAIRMAWVISLVWASSRTMFRPGLVRQYAGLRLGGTDASVVAICERLGIVTVATVNLRDFAAVRPRHIPVFITVPGPS